MPTAIDSNEIKCSMCYDEVTNDEVTSILYIGCRTCSTESAVCVSCSIDMMNDDKDPELVCPCDNKDTSIGSAI